MGYRAGDRNLDLRPDGRLADLRWLDFDSSYRNLDLEEDRAKVEGWLRSPPPAEDVDPTRVPRAHREFLLDAAKAVFAADGVIDPKERESFELLEQLLV